jgi:hypothetical protein
MMQRLIFDALKQGSLMLAQDPSLLEDMFGPESQYGYSTAEIEAIKTIFKTTAPYPVHGYAGRDHTFPLWAILLAGEQESERALGDDTGFVDDPDDPEFGTDLTGSIWDHNYAVLVYGLSPDVCSYCYEVARSILMLARRDWVNQYGYHNIRLSGADLAPDPRYFPEHMFIRQLTVSGSGEHSFPVEGSKFGRAWKVAGMHVDKSGSPSDVGGVKTLIYPIEP